MKNLISKPIVAITHVLISCEERVQYFATPEDCATFPKQAIWVALGNKEKCWIEVFPVGSDDSEGIDDFSDDMEVTVNIDNSFFPPGMPYVVIKDLRWFALLDDK